MARNGILALFFLLLVAADVSDASILWRLRKLKDTTSKNNTQSVYPSLSPVTINGTSDPPAPNNSSLNGNPVPLPAGSNSSNGSNTDEGKNPKPKDADKSKTNPDLTIDKNCGGVLHSCPKLKLLLCIRSNPIDASGNSTVIVQNEGESIFNGTLTAGSFSKTVDVAGHNSSTINITSLAKITELRIKSADGECPLSLIVSEDNLFIQFPSFDHLATPINAAYFLILSVSVFGGSWLCCKCIKKRRHGGIPYQELEMGQSDSISANNTIVESAQGWDQDWDDDWDEENAIKSSGGLNVRSVSANGLTARAANKDGWEDNWDD